MKKKEAGWICERCKETFVTRSLLSHHIKTVHENEKGKPLIGGKCKFCERELKYNVGLINHEKHCKKNPDRIPGHVHHHTEEMKSHLSEKRKEYLRQHENDFGAFTKRWNRKPSYPEVWFMKVIENENFDKNFISEMRFGKYVLDFAWPDKKCCIEVDGSQHQWPDRILSDEKKDEFIRDKGWEILRIKWKDCFNDPKLWIEKAKQFIEMHHQCSTDNARLASNQ
jgi:very-short-patch-repair endonuclease